MVRYLQNSRAVYLGGWMLGLVALLGAVISSSFLLVLIPAGGLIVAAAVWNRDPGAFTKSAVAGPLSRPRAARFLVALVGAGWASIGVIELIDRL